MFDQILTLAIQHYVISGFLAVTLGILLSLAFTAGPEIMHSLRMHKLY